MASDFVPFVEEVKINANASQNEPARLLEVCRTLLDMGFSTQMVFGALKYFEFQDTQSVADIFIKGPYWPHLFISGPSKYDLCQICGEAFDQHLESTVGIEIRDVARILPLKIFDEFPIDQWRTEIQCKICFEGVPLGHAYHLNCGHMYCKQCVKEFINEKINNREVLELKCPEEGCDLRFAKEHISHLCDEEIFEKYIKFREDYEVSMNKKLRWCPRPNCGRYVENPEGKTHFKCACGMDVCFDCGSEWQDDHHCKGNSDTLYNYWAKDKNIQLCPRCRIRIEKDHGCNHMTCTHCRYQWCWICGDEYSSDHYSGYFFLCPMAQFTNSDWGMKRIILYHFLFFIISPLISIITAFGFVGEFFYELLERRRSFKCLLGFSISLIILVLSLILGTLMIIPTLGFRFYCLIHAIDRAING